VSDKTLNLRMTGDGSGLNATLRDATGNVRTFTTEVEQSNAKVASGNAASAQSYRQVSSAANDAQAAIRRMGSQAVDTAVEVKAALSAVDKYGGTFAGLERLAADEDLVTSAFKRGTISAEQHAAAIAGIGSKRTALQEIEQAANKTGGAFSKLHFETAGVTQEVSRLGSEALRGNFQRMESSGIVLAQRMGLLGLAFSGVGLAIGGVLAVGALLIGWMVQGSFEADRLNKAIIATGNFAGVTASSVEQMSRNLATGTTTITEAKRGDQRAGASGKFTVDQIPLIGQAVVDVSKVTGKSIGEVIAQFEELRKAPLQAALKLDETLHFLSESTLNQASAFENAGDKADAFSVIITALAANAHPKMLQMAADAGYVEKAFSRWQQGFANIKGFVFDWGKPATDLDRLDSAVAHYQKDLAKYESAVAVASDPGHLVETYNDLMKERAAVVALQVAYNAKNAAAENQGKENALAKQALDDAAAFDKLAQSLAKKDASFQQSHVAAVQAEIDQKVVAESVGLTAEQVEQLRYRLTKQADAALTNAQVLDQQAAAHKAAGEAARLQAQDENTLQQVLNKASEEIQKADALAADLSDQLTGPLEAAQKKYNESASVIAKGIAGINTQLANGVIGQQQYAAEFDKFVDAESDAHDVLDATNALLLKRNDVVGEYLLKIADETALVGLTDRERAQTQAVQEAVKAWNEKTDAMRREEIEAGHLNPTTEAGARAIRDATAALYDQQQAADLTKQAVSDYVGIWKSAGDSLASTFAKVLVHGGSLFSGLKDLAKQTVESIIQYFVKLSVINPILNSVFGSMAGGSSMLPTMANASGLFGGASGGGNGLLGLASNVVGGGSGDASSGGSGFSLFSPSTWLTAGKSIYEGFSSGFSNIGSSVGTFFNGTPSVANAGMAPVNGGFYGTTDWSAAGNYGAVPGGGAFASGPAVPTYGGYGSALGEAIGGAASLYAAYNAYKSTGGGAMGALAGATYGVGTFVAGGAIAGGLAGTGAIAGGTAAAGSIGLAAIPVVGWIALIAMAINMISGGKLFGTAGKPVGGGQTETIGPDGASVTAEMTTKGQRAFFGGAYWKEHPLAVDPAAQKAADDFYAALKNGTADFAAQFGATAGALVGGSFTQNFDKKGKPTTTTDTVLGVTYKGETQQQFAERLQADNFLAVLDSMGIGASKFAESAQADADALFKLVQDMAQTTQAVQADIKHNLSLLGDDHAIKDVMAEVFKLNAGGETLAQTYTNLQTSTQALSNDLKLAHDATSLTGTALVEFANDAAKAAGGAQALASLIQQFDAVFYTTGQQAAINMAQQRTNVASEMGRIGEDPSEGLAAFKQHFDAIRDTLSPEELVNWYQAGVDLAALNTQMRNAAGAYTQFMDQFKTDPLTNFEKAMVGLGLSIADNIAKANDLALANGQAGASAEDIGSIIAASVMQGVSALRQLQSETAQLAGQLFGSTLDQLKKQEADFEQTGLIDFDRVKKIKDIENGKSAQQQLQQAVGLIGNFGQIGAITGQTLGELANEFNVPLDKLASLLGTDGEGLQKDFTQQVAAAKAALDTAHNTEYTNHLLADILAQSRGKPLPYSETQLAEEATGKPVQQALAPGGKPVGSQFAPPTTVHLVAAAPTSIGNAQPNNTSEANTAVAAIPATLQQGNDRLMQRLDQMNNELSSLRQTLTRFGMVRVS
jgi:phage-related minor tail protein